MYSSILLVLVLTLAAVPEPCRTLETLFQLDGDGEGAGGGGDFSSPLYEESYDTELDDDQNRYLQQQPDQQPPAVLDEVYYRVTPAGHESESEKTFVTSGGGGGGGSGGSTTTGNSILAAGVDSEELPSTDRTSSTSSTSPSSSSSSSSSSEDNPVSVAQAFVGGGGTSNRDAFSSRSLDHDTADSLQSSTVLESNFASNFLYTGGTYNDSYHSNSGADESVEKPSDDPLDSGEDESQFPSTTTFIPLLSIPEIAIKPTKPHIDESKIPKTELLARMLTDKNLRLPIAILVDTCNESLSYSKKVFDAALVPRSPMDVILIRYNNTAIAKSISFRNTKSLMEAINSLQPSYDNSAPAYYSILRTCQEIPYDSAIFLATSNAAVVEKNIAHEAALALLRKRIRLYIIWFGDEVDRTLSDQYLDSQTGLHELAYRTGGRVIRFEIDHHFGNNPVLTTLVSESELHGDNSIPIPVTADVSSLYFKLHGNLGTATLRTPNGYIIDLRQSTVSSNVNSNVQPKIITAGHRNEHEFRQSKSPAVEANGSRDYIFVISPIDTTGEGVYWLNLSDAIKDSGDLSPLTKGHEAGSNPRRQQSYGVTIKADYNRMRHGITLLEHGDPLLEHHFDNHGNDVDVLTGNELDALKHQQIRRTVADGDGHQSAKQTFPEGEESGVQGRAAIQSVTKVDVGIDSQLMGTRGSSIRVIFEVTNFRQTGMLYYFRVTGEKRFLQFLNPGSAFVNPGQTISVVVTLRIPTNAEVGSRDKITFYTEGPDTVSQAAWVTVTDSSGLSDAYQPSIWYTYSSRCEGRSSPGTCSGAFWTVDIAARDWETGIMKIASSPTGILYKNPFTAGTREEVKATYTASCCQPKVTITAHDASKNARTISLDVTDIWLNEAGIAAVVLGVLLLIALIILLVLLIRYCIRRRKRSQDLPIYRGETRRTR
ncbi:uncharacterized protein LOC131431413 [Malaya genurostris]|uniref:uncharacterized protein LOC131431413 n=1 Tax=Malaya genurostris TaxID=325434 RepID=UPI0026F3C804|nr:uncharacterized protein LOC131431413 [Malaya genurostris]XP_058453104.1 uncharacterized protein LOC131431413 [Malaya genurostris]XP_058453113.1 uncharacterized protein LOC131431413 [Malaya genurostris]XP_058453122.1 uncharacterized protein LOC131431413 [Malaya genurostris]XP_058453129.1 uncharacterized protein LOC131431413 [Malaya genurostris]XP_058453137.1 uncharacterized protein LOC131431413 [Malaya genurostris]XP_058453147.1 uncharacterized protein LOC131431413 [Malaya genurostris]XP_0